jgi:integrase
VTVVQLRTTVDVDDRLDRARRALDVTALVARGWDPERHVFAPSPDDPLFGWAACERSGCGRGARGPAARRLGLCELCLVNYRSRYQGQLSVTEYKRRPVMREVDRELCLVCRTPGHQRPAQRQGLCNACSRLRRSRGVSVAVFVAGDDRSPPAAPRPSLPLCDVLDCDQWVEYGRLGLCGRCYQRWSRERPSLDGFKPAGVPHRSPIFDGRHACLADLPPLVEAQLLLGIQRVIKLGVRVGADSFERVARRVRDGWVEDVAVLSDASVLAPRDSEMFTTLRVILEAASDAMTDVESEFQRDVWHLRVLYPATRHQTRVISFVEISQRWLRELTKVWCQRRSASIAESTLYQSACCTRGLSRFLGTLPHRGERPELLTREDLDRFLLWQCASSTPEYSRTNVRRLREVLRFARRYGHTAAGGIAAGLSEEFSLLDEDVRVLNRRAGENCDYEPGKAIPEYVLHQLLEPATLELLTNEDARVIFQLLAHTGRRPVEICALDADCLEWAEQAATGPRRPLLRYKREKPPKKRITLPITAEAAELIERQQVAALERYQGRTLRDLKLFPSAKKNTDGRRPIMTYSFGVMLRRWVDGLSLVSADGEPFPSVAVHAYALRHSYAQRHADSVDPVVPVDVLQKLMDHRSIQTTQGYYRVRAERLHEAVRASAPLTINRDGARVGGSDYPDVESITRSVGRIPVPLGHCVEPHNVKALGSACPFSHQCLGCVHFRTDPSYLPDLYAYLEQLLDARERLNAAVPQLRDWAREKAVPNDAEIKAVRNLIRSNEALLAELEPVERRKLEELFAALRGARAQAENRLAIHDVGAIAQSEPTFSPPVVSLKVASAAGAA